MVVQREGGCLCRSVRYSLRGEPIRAGLCHCGDCRKESGSSFVTFALWPRENFSFAGEIGTYHGRSCCPRCGSRLFNLDEETVEVRVGSLDDAPNGIEPQYEIWVKRREGWLHPLPGKGQWDEDRFSAD